MTQVVFFVATTTNEELLSTPSGVGSPNLNKFALRASADNCSGCSGAVHSGSSY